MRNKKKGPTGEPGRLIPLVVLIFLLWLMTTIAAWVNKDAGGGGWTPFAIRTGIGAMIAILSIVVTVLPMREERGKEKDDGKTDDGQPERRD